MHALPSCLGFLQRAYEDFKHKKAQAEIDEARRAEEEAYRKQQEDAESAEATKRKKAASKAKAHSGYKRERYGGDDDDVDHDDDDETDSERGREERRKSGTLHLPPFLHMHARVSARSECVVVAGGKKAKRASGTGDGDSELLRQQIKELQAQMRVLVESTQQIAATQHGAIVRQAGMFDAFVVVHRFRAHARCATVQANFVKVCSWLA